VSLSLANHDASLPVAYQLYLPKEWAKDRARRRKAGVPKEIGFKTKPQIALEQLHWACASGLPHGVVLMDAGYGADTDLRATATLRPERHIPNSIATVRRRLIAALVSKLPRFL
jgi:SRSO17 transposase